MRNLIEMLTFMLIMLFAQFSGYTINLNGDTNQRYSKYINKPLYEFLLDDSIRCYKHIDIVQEPPGKLAGVFITLMHERYIKVILNDSITTPFNKGGNWKFEEVIKEHIFRIYITDKHGKVLSTLK